MVLIILSITSLGAVSYWNGYRLLTDTQKRNIQENLSETVYHMEVLNKEVENGRISLEKAKENVVSYYESFSPSGLVILENNSILLNLFQEADFLDFKLDKSFGAIEKKGTVFLYSYYEPWDWIVGYGLKTNIFSEELISIQKYNLLIVIVSLIISMQATILIAYNLSRPIRSLADSCNKIASGNFDEKICIKRTDEIGILANAFNNMICKLQKNTSKLLEVKQFNEDILRNVSTGIITIDSIGSINSINYTAEKMLRSNILLSGTNENLENTLIGQSIETIKTEKSMNHVYDLYDSNINEIVYVDVTTSLLKNENNEISGAICNFHNITERKNIEKQIERVNRLTSVGQLAAGMAHEIRNPLAGMKTSIQVLKKRLSVNESNEELFKGVLYEIDRLNNLITDMLDFAKPNLPKYELANILEILKKSLYLINKAANEKNIKITIINEALKYMVKVDQGQIEQIFLNIITNAIMAMNTNGFLTILVKNINTKKGEYISLEFNDNGCGINPEDIEKIFDPFYTTTSNGTGLGLSVVHELVEKNRGEIEVYSKINDGTQFKVKFMLEGGE